MNWQHNQHPPNHHARQEEHPVSRAVQSSHSSLVSYPMASATPTNHVARHLSTMSTPASSPAFTQQYPHQAYQEPPPYTEYPDAYSAQLAPYASPAAHYNSTHWQREAETVARMLSQPSNHYYPQYQVTSPWPTIRQPSQFQPTSFAHQIFQTGLPYHFTPINPPRSSTSSLAYALGPPPPPSVPVASGPPVQPTFIPKTPAESKTFYEQYISQQASQINSSKSHSSKKSGSALQPFPQIRGDSPDPLAIGPSSSPRASSQMQSSSVVVTPRKRRSESQLHSPSIKRVQTMPASRTLSSPIRPNVTPTIQRTAFEPGTPTHKLTPGRNYKLAYVAVPPKPWLTPSSDKGKGKMRSEANRSPDLEGYDSIDDEDYLSARVKHGMYLARSSARRTGDRDDRGPLEKLISLLDDIFEAEDTISPDDPSTLNPAYFLPNFSAPSNPLLLPSHISRLTKLFSSLSRSPPLSKPSSSSPPKFRAVQIEVHLINRILRIIERSFKAGELGDPLKVGEAGHDKAQRAVDKDKKKASKKGKIENGDRSSSPSMDVDVEVDLEALRIQLDAARDGVIAAEACFTILTCDSLPKELYSEELIVSVLECIQQQLTRIIYPFVENAHSPTSSVSTTSQKLLQQLLTSSSTSLHRQILSDIFQSLTSCLPRITRLVSSSSIAMSDTIIIQAVYISIGPFFVAEQGLASEISKAKKEKEDIILKTFGKSAMRGLRLEALGLIRTIFARHEEQRSWIIEEILNSLIKLSDLKSKHNQFRLRNGQSIRTVSALLLQLVQTSAYDVRLGAAKIRKARVQAAQKHDNLHEGFTEAFLDLHDLSEIQLYQAALDPATKVAKSIIMFLTTRSGKGKITKNSNEAEYRSIFEGLVSDILVVLYWPEWPAANLILGILTRFMISSLDEIKTNSQSDNNAMRSFAIDQLGIIAAKLRQSSLNAQKLLEETPSALRPLPALKPLDELVKECRVDGITSLIQRGQELSTYLCKQSSEDHTYDSARELTAATWGHDLATALRLVDSHLADSEDNMAQSEAKQRILSVGMPVKRALRDVWKDDSVDLFDMGSQEETAHIDRIAEHIGTSQSLRNGFHAILNVIVTTLDAPAIFMRTKALRALGQVVTVDPLALSSANVRRAIESHLLDSSPAVRDAAVELIGKYMLESKEVADIYFQKIADRVADTGINVRKRVLKLLKAVYAQSSHHQRQIEIAIKITQRVSDEDETVRDLAAKTIQELWFEEPSAIPTTPSRRKAIVAAKGDKGHLQQKVVVIMGVAASRQTFSILETLLCRILGSCSIGEASIIHAQYGAVCETLIEGLVDAADLPGFTVLNSVKVLYLFCSACPDLLSGSELSTLLPYLTNGTTAEDSIITDHLLKVFRASIPYMSKNTGKFGLELQSTLQTMVTKPALGFGVLQESIACLCSVVKYLTHEAHRLVSLMKSCTLHLHSISKKESLNTQELKSSQILLLIVSLLARHFDFESLRSDSAAPQLKHDLDQISSNSVIDHVYSLLLSLHQKVDEEWFQARVLHCLGFLFQAQPTLMTLDTSATIMDHIFSSPNEQSQTSLLKIIQEFLISEATKHSEKNKARIHTGDITVRSNKLNMDELIGNTEGFADSGVASAVVQRYSSYLHQAALSRNPLLQSPAIDILCFTVRQGLSHPLESLSVVVALETDINPVISSRANALHAFLHGKHASILANRTLPSATTAFEYQQQLTGSLPRGLEGDQPPVAHLHYWYTLVRDKRSIKLEFLRNLCRVFDIPVTLNASEKMANLARYIAENLSAFEYKTLEEPLYAIKQLTTVLSTAGTQIANSFAGPSQGVVNNDIIWASILVALAIDLKAYLKNAYGLSEEKCSSFASSKKAGTGEKPAVRRTMTAISWHWVDILGGIGPHDTATFASKFLEMWNEDGMQPEPQELEDM